MNETILNEIRQRLTRVESRICRIGDHVGASVGDPKKTLEIVDENEDAVVVSTPVMDLTLSEIRQFLTSRGKEDKVAFVQFRGQTVCRMSRH